MIPLWPDAPPEVLAWVEWGDEVSAQQIRDHVWAPPDPVSAPETRLEEWVRAWVVATRRAICWAFRGKISRAESFAQSALHRPQSAEEARQKHTLQLLQLLPNIIAEHGLSARLLDEVREDSWLSLQVARALQVPDQEVWKDWFDGMAEERIGRRTDQDKGTEEWWVRAAVDSANRPGLFGQVLGLSPYQMLLAHIDDGTIPPHHVLHIIQDEYPTLDTPLRPPAAFTSYESSYESSCTSAPTPTHQRALRGLSMMCIPYSSQVPV